MSPPLNPGKDGGGAGAHLRGAKRGRGKMGGGGGVDEARGGWGGMESLTTCGLLEHAECCTRVSAPRNVSPKASITACERKTSVVPYVKRKTA